MNNEPQQSQSPTVNYGTGPRARTWIIWLIALGGIILLMILKDQGDSSRELLTQAKFEQLLDAGAIKSATVSYNAQTPLNTILGSYYRTNGTGSASEVPFRVKVRLTAPLENKIFGHPQFEPRESDSVLMSLAVSVLPFIIIAVLIWFFFIRQINRPTSRINLQHDRLDKILTKWEIQLNRFEAVLEKWERSQRS